MRLRGALPATRAPDCSRSRSVSGSIWLLAFHQSTLAGAGSVGGTGLPVALPIEPASSPVDSCLGFGRGGPHAGGRDVLAFSRTALGRLHRTPCRDAAASQVRPSLEAIRTLDKATHFGAPVRSPSRMPEGACVSTHPMAIPTAPYLPPALAAAGRDDALEAVTECAETKHLRDSPPTPEPAACDHAHVPPLPQPRRLFPQTEDDCDPASWLSPGTHIPRVSQPRPPRLPPSPPDGESFRRRYMALVSS
jgi:hypothetical protein